MSADRRECPGTGFRDFRPGDHVCCLYAGHEERARALVLFIEEGLVNNERVLCVEDARGADGILRLLKPGRTDPGTCVSRKQLIFMPPGDFRLKSGRFSGKRMEGMLGKETEAALEDGYSALRVALDTSLAFESVPGTDRLAEYEAKVGCLCSGNKSIVLCLYDRGKFAAENLLEVIRAHPAAAMGERVYRDLHCIPSESLSGRADRESGKFFRTLAANVPGVIYRRSCDKDWTLDFISREIKNLSGYPPEDFIKSRVRSYTSIIHPDDRAPLEKTVLERVRAGRPFTASYRLITSGGGTRWVREKGRGVFGDNGELLYLDGIILDITDQKLAEDALKENNAFIKAVMDNLPIGIAVNSVKSSVDFVYMNENFPEIYGTTREELMKPGAFWDSVYRDPVFREKLKKRVLDDCASGNPARMNWENVPVLREDGETAWISARNIPVPGKDMMVSTVRDVTKQKKAEDALRKSEKRFRDIAESAGEYLWELDRDSRYVFASGKIEEVFERPLSSIMGRTPFEFMPGDEAERVKQIFSRIAENRKAFNKLECRLLMPDGRVKWEIVNGVPVYDLKGRFAGYRGAALDITARKKSEEDNKALIERMELILSSTNTNIDIIDPDYNMVYLNPGWQRVYGAFEGKKCYEYFMGGLSPCGGCGARQAALAGKSFIWEHSFPREKNRCVQTTSFPFRDENGSLLIAKVHTDITELKKSERRINYLSIHDSLTGLYNRAHAEREFRRLDSRENMPLGVMLFDVNGLRLVNDSYGQSIGDALLLEASRIVKKFSGRRGVPARWAADEFIIIKPRTSSGDAEKIAGKIREAAQSASLGRVQLSLSSGFAVKRDPREKRTSVLKEAEGMLDKNKLQETSSFRSSMIKTLLNTLSAVSNETGEHTTRLREIALALGQSINLPRPELDRLSLLVTLHDIGKIAVPEAVLAKAGKLTPREWEIVKKHSETGYKIASSTREFAHVAEEILTYHERWDGGGYPTGASGGGIPVLARIGAIVDAYDAMTNDRPYRAAMAEADALAELQRCAGKQFDPGLVEKFLQIKKERR